LISTIKQNADTTKSCRKWSSFALVCREIQEFLFLIGDSGGNVRTRGVFREDHLPRLLLSHTVQCGETHKYVSAVAGIFKGYCKFKITQLWTVVQHNHLRFNEL